MNQLNKRFLYWLFWIVLAVCVLLFSSSTTTHIEMTRSQYELVKGAVELVIKDIDAGNYTSTGQVLDALSAELPASIKDSFLSQLGTPKFSELKEKLTVTVSSITPSE